MRHWWVGNMGSLPLPGIQPWYPGGLWFRKHQRQLSGARFIIGLLSPGCRTFEGSGHKRGIMERKSKQKGHAKCELRTDFPVNADETFSWDILKQLGETSWAGGDKSWWLLTYYYYVLWWGAGNSHLLLTLSINFIPAYCTIRDVVEFPLFSLLLFTV